MDKPPNRYRSGLGECLVLFLYKVHDNITTFQQENKATYTSKFAIDGFERK